MPTTQIATPIITPTHAEAVLRLSEAQRVGADLVELRLDHLVEPIDLPRLLAASPLPAIITCRASREGGRWSRGEAERLALLQQAVDLGAAYVDVEADAITKIRPRPGTLLIASRHNFQETPRNLDAQVRALEALPCDIVKWATTATALEDNLRCFAALAALKKPGIGICMGELGEMSRILTGRYGGLLTFGSLVHGEESAPGQLTVAELVELYRVREINTTTPLYAVIGDPIAHSMSPEIHNRAFTALGLAACYLKLRVTDFPAFLTEVAEPLGLRGISVTIPHKHEAYLAATERDPLAERIGAVNTLTRTARGWHGDNTDCHAAVGAIRSAAGRAGFALQGAKAVVLGAGGTARALALGLVEAGAEVCLANRTLRKAEALAAELGIPALPLAEAASGAWRVIANTTSVGMHPNIGESPIAGSAFRPGMVVFDAVYNPLETRLLREARAAEAETATGLEMFVGQAARQFERWSGEAAPLELMEQVVRRRLGDSG